MARKIKKVRDGREHLPHLPGCGIEVRGCMPGCWNYDSKFDGPAPKTGFRSSPFQVVPVAYDDAARMHTVEPDSKLWNGDRHAITAAPGLFVRLRPPPGADPTAVESLKQTFLKAGALAVRVVPAAKAEVLPPLADKKAPAPHRTIREVVTAMVAEANSQDREALAALVEVELSKAGV